MRGGDGAAARGDERRGLIERERALEIAAAAAATLPSEEIDAARGAGRVLAEPLVAAAPLPPFDRALRDGYAVRSADLFRPPAVLRVVGTLLAGQARAAGPAPGECWRVMTGAEMPAQADAVVMAEEATEVDPGAVRFDRPVAPGAHVARAGSEAGPGETLAHEGTRLTPPALALALATGRARVRVRRRPRVAILSSGSELAPPGCEPAPGQIPASNPWLLAAAAEREGAEVVSAGIAPDREAEQRRAVERGLAADLLLTSGGTGRGRADLTRRVLEGCGVEILFQGVAVEPGRPVLCGRRGATLVFGLPGTPAAVWVLWRTLVEPCLRRVEGESAWRPRLWPARLASPVEHAIGVEVWIPADLSHAGAERVARPRGPGRTGSLRAHLGAGALLRIPPSTASRTPAGAQVEMLE